MRPYLAKYLSHVEVTAELHPDMEPQISLKGGGRRIAGWFCPAGSQHWTGSGRNEELRVQTATYTAPAVGSDYPAMVAAMNQTLTALSHDIAGALKGGLIVSMLGGLLAARFKLTMHCEVLGALKRKELE